MRVLVTGGAGFIGSHLVDVLIERGDSVEVLDDLSTGALSNLQQAGGNVSVHKGSVLDTHLVEALVDKVDAVYHLAAAVGVRNILVEPVAGLRVNVGGTSTVVEACARRKVPLLFASTSEVYGKTTKLPMAEFDDRVLGPTSITRWWYSTSKALDEHLAVETARAGLPVAIVRYFNTYGPRLAPNGYGSVVAAFIRRALANEPLVVHGDGSQTRCFTFVGDSVRATVAAAGRADTSGEQIFNVGTTVELSIRELAERVVALCGSRSAITYVPYETAYGKGFEDTARRLPSIARATQILGWRPTTTLDDGLLETIQWWQSTSRDGSAP